MRTWEQSKRRLSNEKLPGHDSYDDKTALQGWSFSAGEFSNNACTPYLWACDIHVSFVKFAGSNWSNKNVHASQVPISPHPHRRFETTHRSDIAVSYGSMEQLKDLPHFARELMSKATPQKRRRKKNIHNNIVHVSLNGFFYSYHKPQVFLVPFSQLIDICVKNHKY